MRLHGRALLSKSQIAFLPTAINKTLAYPAQATLKPSIFQTHTLCMHFLIAYLHEHAYIGSGSDLICLQPSTCDRHGMNQTMGRLAFPAGSPHGLPPGVVRPTWHHAYTGQLPIDYWERPLRLFFEDR